MIGDTQYNISGNLIDINESAKTCTIQFKNKRIAGNISLDDVYINERFIDTVRNYGKKFAAWIVKKVRGLMCILNGDGEQDENSFFTPVNLAIKQSKGELPSWAKFYANDNLVEQAEEIGIPVDALDQNDFLADAEAKDIEQINNFWHRFMQRYGSTDETLEETFESVNRQYYKNCHPKQLNEAGPLSFVTPTDAFGRNDLDGRWVNANELKAELFKSIDAQLNLTFEKALEDDDEEVESKHDFSFMTPELRQKVNQRVKDYKESLRKSIDSEDYKTRIPLVWGAPGIGKTQIIRQVLKDYKAKQNRNLYLYEITCGGLNSDSFRLPERAKPVSIDGQEMDPVFEQAVLSWLPMYTPKDEKYNKEAEERFSRCQHISRNYMTGENQFQGGILFLDEVVRVEDQAFPVIMSICDRKLNEKRLAKSWGIICAANRAEDDPGQAALTMMDNAAIMDRFVHLNFVPKKKDWVVWARSIKGDEGQNIAPKIVDFVETMDVAVWYRMFGNGGYNDDLRNNPNIGKDVTDSLTSMTAGNKEIGVISKKVLDLIEDPEDDPRTRTKQFWNPRTWERISNEYRRMLTNLLQDNPKNLRYADVLGASIEYFDYYGAYDEVLKEALEFIPVPKWNEFCIDYFSGTEEQLNEAIRASRASGSVKLEYINKALVNIVNTFCGGNNTLPARKMAEYFDWQAKLGEHDVLDDIYNHGELITNKDNKLKDNLYPDVENSNGQKGFSWKSNEAIIRKVYSFLLTKYPGGKFAANDEAMACAKYLNEGFTQMSGRFKTLGTSSSAGALQKADEILQKSFGPLKHKFNRAKFDEFFTVKTPGRFGDVKIFTCQNDTIASIIWNMVQEYKFVFYILNYIKYCVKIAFTSSSGKLKTKALELYANGPGKFCDEMPKILELSAETTQMFSSINNIVTDVYSQMVDPTMAKNYGDLKYIDMNKLFMACLIGAINSKKLSNFKK